MSGNAVNLTIERSKILANLCRNAILIYTGYKFMGNTARIYHLGPTDAIASRVSYKNSAGSQESRSTST